METELNRNRVVIVSANDPWSIVVSAAVIRNEIIAKKVNFNLKNDIIIIDPKKILDVDATNFNQIYLIGMEGNLSKKELGLFLARYYQKIVFYYSDKNLDKGVKGFLKGIVKENFFFNTPFSKFLSDRYLAGSSLNLELLELANLFDVLQKKQKGTLIEAANRILMALYASEIYDRNFSKKQDLYQKKIIKRLVIELATKKKIKMVSDFIVKYKNIVKNNDTVNRNDFIHPIIGKIKVISPDTEEMIIDRKLLFETYLKNGVAGVAIKIFSEKGPIYEVCVKKEHATDINESQIPIVKKISSCRFLAEDNFILESEHS